MAQNKLAALKRKQYRQRIIDAYELYVKDGEAVDQLWPVIQEFATMKMYRLEHDFKDVGTIETVDDWAQKVVFDVWKQLPNFRKKTGEAFYAWLHKITYTQRQNAKYGHPKDRVLDEKGNIVQYGEGSLVHQKQNKVTFTITAEDEDGEESVQENPVVSAQLNTAQFSYTLPEHLMSWHEIRICNDIMVGYNYKQIAERLGTTENAIKQAVKALRNRVAKDRKATRDESNDRWTRLETPKQRTLRGRVEAERQYRRPQTEIDAEEPVPCSVITREIECSKDF